MPPTPPAVAPTVAELIDALPVEAELAQHDSPEAMRRALIRAADLTPQHVDGERLDLLKQYTDWIWEPVLHEGPFDFGAIVRQETTVKRPGAF